MKEVERRGPERRLFGGGKLDDDHFHVEAD